MLLNMDTWYWQDFAYAPKIKFYNSVQDGGEVCFLWLLILQQYPYSVKWKQCWIHGVAWNRNVLLEDLRFYLERWRHINNSNTWRINFTFCYTFFLNIAYFQFFPPSNRGKYIILVCSLFENCISIDWDFNFFYIIFKQDLFFFNLSILRADILLRLTRFLIK